MSEGVLYEPRSLWSIANVAADDTNVTNVRMDKRHFYNGERWPITIKRMTFMAVNYSVFDTPQASAVDPTIGADEAGSIINKIRVSVSASQRFHFNSRRTLLIPGISARPRWMPQTGTTNGGEGLYLPSSLYGQCNLNFDKPLFLPRNGTIQWDLSAYTPWNTAVVKGNDQNNNASAWMVYQEEGGLWPGSARCRQVQLQAYVGDLSQADPEAKWPYPPDGFGAGALGPAVSTTTDWWAPLSRFPAGGGAERDFTGAPGTGGPLQKSFAAQESTRSGSTKITGMRTFIEQILYDVQFSSQMFPIGATSRSAPLSMRVGTRVRTENSGSKTWWWRPGAPLALVFDSITPACVYEFPEPFTMGPGDQLDVELLMPPNVENFTTTFHIGVAFNGYASIEG